jgi:pyruvate formate lyase activating enzyme
VNINILQANEVRKAHFLKVFNRKPEDMQIISFGKCNYNCPYCKRDGQFKNENGNIIYSYDVTMEQVKKVIDTAISKGRRIRLSGGDPCMFIEESLHIAKYVMKKHGQKISIAHNGSSLKLINQLLPYLDYVAIDYKGGTAGEIAYRSNTKEKEDSIETILKIIDVCKQNNVLCDVRTVVFGDTSYISLLSIAEELQKYDNVFWTLRKYVKVEGCNFKEASVDLVRKYVDELKTTYDSLNIGMRDKWTGETFYIPKSQKN